MPLTPVPPAPTVRSSPKHHAVQALALSVVVPLYDEADSVPTLTAELRQAIDPLGLEYELIYVDDGSRDATAATCAAQEGVTLIAHARNRGQSAATLTGIRAARGRLILTLDGDGQNDPASIPALFEALDGQHDVAVGYRAQRRDTVSRRFASRLAYRVRHLVLGDGIVDIGCSLRLFPRDEGLRLPAFDGVHRLMPALFVFRGLRVAQVPTHHRPRVAGRSKYDNAKRGLRGLFDLLGLFWLKRRLLRVDPA